MTTRLGRRTFGGLFAGALARFAIGCGAAPAASPKALPPLRIDTLTDVVTSAGLLTLIIVKPREIAQIPWLIPEISLFADEKNFDAFAADTGVDLREIRQAIIAHYDDSLGSADLQLARGAGDPAVIEKQFDKRVTTGIKRAEDRPDLVRVSGVIGTRAHAFARLGPDIVAFQDGGESERGPLRVAALYAEGRIDKPPRALDAEPLKGLATRFGSAPLVALARGPFEDEWRGAAKGLLEGATGAGVAFRPTAREHIGIAIAIASDFSTSGDDASDVLIAAWKDFADTEMGSLLGLDHPIEGPLATHTRDAVALSIEVEPTRFASGLHALVSEDLEAIMRLASPRKP